jgi:hypothetical protein
MEDGLIGPFTIFELLILLWLFFSILGYLWPTITAWVTDQMLDKLIKDSEKLKSTDSKTKLP